MPNHFDVLCRATRNVRGFMGLAKLQVSPTQRCNDGDTIAALATAPGRAGVAVIRLSGPVASDALRRLAGRVPPPTTSRS